MFCWLLLLTHGLCLGLWRLTGLMRTRSFCPDSHFLKISHFNEKETRRKVKSLLVLDKIEHLMSWWRMSLLNHFNSFRPTQLKSLWPCSGTRSMPIHFSSVKLTQKGTRKERAFSATRQQGGQFSTLCAIFSRTYRKRMRITVHKEKGLREEMGASRPSSTLLKHSWITQAFPY